MKIRQGFVSNSSSSSFVCDITGEEVQGMDLDISDAGMYSCEEGHYFSEEFLVGNLPEDEDVDYYEVPRTNCPICSFIRIAESDMVLYIEKNYNIKSSEVFSYMKEKNKRLKKLRSVYWFEYLEKIKNVSKMSLETEIKNRFSSLEKFENYLGE